MTATNTQQTKNSKAPAKAQRKEKTTTARPRVSRKSADTSELRAWLDSQAFQVHPDIHVNGPNHPTAVIAVDFGSPIGAVRLTSDQAEKLGQRLKSLTRDLYSNEVNVRVSSDNQNGVFWTSVAQ